MSAKHVFAFLGLGILGLTGCLSPVRQEVDALLCKRAAVPVDLLPPRPDLPPPANEMTQFGAGGIQLTAGKDDKPGPLKFGERLEPSRNLPGAEIKRPGNFMKLSAKEQAAVIAQYFPAQLPMGADPRPMPGPDGQPLALSDLQRLAREHSPLLRKAASDIAAAEGAVIQAGVYPNPTFSIASNAISFTSGSTFTPLSVSQPIKTMGKLWLAQASAKMDLANAQLAYRRAESDLMASVRTGYFSVMAAQKAMTANKALADLTDEVYKIMLAQVKGGQFANYEVMQLGVYAGQSRIALIQSRNSYLATWKQLASALGLPTLPPTEIGGSIDENLPRFEHEKVLAHVLAYHTDVLTARNAIDKARYNLRLAEVTPVPDITLGAAVLYDATPPGPPAWVPTLSASITLPIFDRNQGGIKQAQAALISANEEPHRVQAALTASVADAFNRLDFNRRALDLYRKQMLPQQVQAFRGTIARHDRGDPGGVGFIDLVSAEQNLVTLIGSYLTTLQAYGQAVSDIASLLQTDDVYRMAEQVENVQVPDLMELLKVPCCHPCANLPNPPPGATLSFESPPGQRVAPEIGEKPSPIAPPPKTPALPKESLILPEPSSIQPTGVIVSPPAALPLAALPPAAAVASPAPSSSMPVRLGPITQIPAGAPSAAGRN